VVRARLNLGWSIGRALTTPHMKPGAKDLSGKAFGELTVSKLLEKRDKRRERVWLCECSCGKQARVRSGLLVSGNTKSCGHLNDAGGLHGTPEYGIHRAMVARCHNPKTANFHNYGGRGIKVCKRWRKSFLVFIEDVGRRPSPELTLDRIDNDGNYEPGNVRWADRVTQARNRRTPAVVRDLTFRGETLPLSVWARKMGLDPRVVRQRIAKLDWTTERALITPVKRTRK